MSSNIESLASFEHLPVEVILLIFDFFSLQQLLASFLNLNSFVNSVIRSVRHKYHGVKNNNIDAIRVLQVFPTVVDRLVIRYSNAANFKSLINLRSLSLQCSTSTQLYSVQPNNFPHLEILHITDFDGTQEDKLKVISDLLEILLSNGFSRLRICTILDIGTVPFNEKWTGTPSLKILNVAMATNEDKVKFQARFRYVRHLTTQEYSFVPDSASPVLLNRKVIAEIKLLKKLESENKFILDKVSGQSIDTNRPPPRFNNTPITVRSSEHYRHTIEGRLLLQSEPYCRASFLLQIGLTAEYPFKYPDIQFLDPIYHPNISQTGVCCGCDCGFRFADSNYRPTLSLHTILSTIIQMIDSPFVGKNGSHNEECYLEYRNDYPTFYRKALDSTLLYGRPRD
ncbi:unnamed protein product [Adineta ricciae]|uniref:UBC core domain-containing protein n=1 Tax=Adineta ricciae TaxID=249248 RepID=A0A815CU45_ADIRI|nr:unnamed protein product [Adineta ricciae]